MKRTLILAALLAGCGNPRTSDRVESEDPIRYQDRETGCMYLTTGQYNALTPRIAVDGKTQMGCKAVQP
jgi:hypothetical protein